uniref:Secreted protein n=1 Tax=Globodera pallida TaxID=36090 RepID=A0A183BUT3_GLOPA
MTKSLLFICWCVIVACLALMAEDKSVLALSNDGGDPRIARYFEGGQLVRLKRACGEHRCSLSLRARAEVCKQRSAMRERNRQIDMRSFQTIITVP